MHSLTGCTGCWPQPLLNSMLSESPESLGASLLSCKLGPQQKVKGRAHWRPASASLNDRKQMKRLRGPAVIQLPEQMIVAGWQGGPELCDETLNIYCAGICPAALSQGSGCCNPHLFCMHSSAASHHHLLMTPEVQCDTVGESYPQATSVGGPFHELWGRKRPALC